MQLHNNILKKQKWSAKKKEKKGNTNRATTRNWSICGSFSWLSGSQTFVSSFSCTRLSNSTDEMENIELDLQHPTTNFTKNVF